LPLKCAHHFLAREEMNPLGPNFWFPISDLRFGGGWSARPESQTRFPESTHRWRPINNARHRRSESSQLELGSSNTADRFASSQKQEQRRMRSNQRHVRTGRRDIWSSSAVHSKFARPSLMAAPGPWKSWSRGRPAPRLKGQSTSLRKCASISCFHATRRLRREWDRARNVPANRQIDSHCAWNCACLGFDDSRWKCVRPHQNKTPPRW